MTAKSDYSNTFYFHKAKSMEITTDGTMFLGAPRLTKDDFDDDVLTDNNSNAIELIEEFEDAWTAFLLSRPEILPPGLKIKNCRIIQNQILENKEKEQIIVRELQRQLDSFAHSINNLEDTYKKDMEDATQQQHKIIASIERNIEDIADADKSLNIVTQYRHFFKNLESLSSTSTSATTTTTPTTTDLSSSSQQQQPPPLLLKPSKEAQYLCNIDHGDVVNAARRKKPKPHLLRAYRTDNALLKAKRDMLRIEAARLEKTIKSDLLLSQFFVEHDFY